MGKENEMTEDEFNDEFIRASFLLDNGQPQRATILFHTLLTAVREEMEDTAEVAIDLRRALGRSLWLSGFANQAVEVLRPALKDAEIFLGWDNRITYACAGNLCRALGDVGCFDEAFEIAFPLYLRRTEEFGELDNGTLNSLGHLSQLLYQAGFVDDAVQLMKEQLEKRTEAFGKNDERTQQSTYNLTVMSAQMNNNEQSLINLLADYTARLGANHAATIGIWAHLGALFERKGHLAEALEMWREVEERRGTTFGEVTIPTLTATKRRLEVERRMGIKGAHRHIRVINRIIAQISPPVAP